MISVKELLKRLLYFPISPAVTTFFFPADSDRTDPGPPPKAIVVIRLDEIGDMVLTSPFLRELRRNYPRAHITLVVKPEVKNLVEHCPYCDELLTFDWRAPRVVGPFIRYARAYRLAGEKLRDRHFDWAVIPRWDFDIYGATALAYFSRARRRIAFSETVNPRKSVINKGCDLLLTDPTPSPAPSHDVSLPLRLLSSLGAQVASDALELWLDDEDRRFALERLPDDPARMTVAIAPGALEKSRQWPVERYLALAAWAVRKFSVRIVVLGGSAEIPLGKILVEGLPEGSVIDLTGRTTLRQSAAILARSALFIGNDTGLKHIAAAMGIDVVEISRFPKNGDPMHPQSPLRFRAWGVENIVLQPEQATPPCGDNCAARRAHCILEVDLPSVKDAVTELIGEGEK
jgi:ADP-heptose:LPS heptosyltransferase